MPWACKVGDKSIRLEDIEIGTLGDIARQCEMSSWAVLIGGPAYDERAAIALIVKCAELLGEKPPTKFTGKTVMEAFVFEDDEQLPEAVDDDGLPTTGAEEDQATGS